MKKRFSLTLILLAIACIAFFALPARVDAAEIIESGTCGVNASYKLYSDGNLVITGSGATRDFPWQSKKDSIIGVFVYDGITEIGSHAFNGCPNLEVVYLPETLSIIGYGAFSSCSKLACVGSLKGYTTHMPDSIEVIHAGAFQNCSSLYDVDLSTSLTTIEYDAFLSSGVTEIIIPGSVSTVGQRAFGSCSKLTQVKIQEGVTSIDTKAFTQCVKLKSVDIPSSVISIGKDAFSSCESLTDVYYNGTETEWNRIAIDNSGDENFANTTIHFVDGGPYVASGSCNENLIWTLDTSGELTISGSGRMNFYWLPSPWNVYSDQIMHITIQEGVASIGSSAFSGCSNLTGISIPDSVTSIGQNAFYKCSSLESISIPDSVTDIGVSAFSQCESLRTINIPSSVKSIDCFSGCKSLTDIEIPNGVTTIGSYAFSGCSSLKSITIPDSVTSIGNRAFYMCDSLTSVTIPRKVASIADGTFYGCSQLANVNIPGRVTSIGQSAFNGCSSLTEIFIPDSVTEIGSSAFGSTSLSDVYYAGSENDWASINIGSNNNPLTQAVMHFNCPPSNPEAQYVVFYSYDTHSEMVFQNSVKPLVESPYVTIYSIYDLDDDGLPYWVINGANPTKVIFAAPVIPHSTMSWFAYFENLQTIEGIELLNTSNVTDMSSMFDGCSSLTEVDVSGFDTRNVTSMAGMFSGCSSLTSLDVSGFDTSTVTSMGSMFRGCSALTALDVSGFDTSNVTNMFSMFSGCNALTSLDVSGFDTSNVTTMYGMFSGCNALTSLDVSGFDTSNVTDMSSMFSGCNALTSLDVSGFDTSKVTYMSSMFSRCNALTSLDVSGFDTSKVTYMSSMFSGCNALTSLDVSGFVTSNVTDTSKMFNGCVSLTLLDVSGFDTHNVRYMANMFDGCGALRTIFAGTEFVPAAKCSDLFAGCTSLIGGNGTPFDPGYVDGTYAKIDSIGVPGYFSDHHALSAIDAVPATCTSPGIEAHWQCSLCDCLFSDATGQTKISAPAAIPALDHTYGEPLWQWNEDLTAASASFSCSRCDHAETVNGDIRDREYVAGVHTTPGYITATGRVIFQGKVYYDPKEIELAAPGHSYGEPVWEWAEDGSTAQIVATCTECDDAIRIDAAVTPSGKRIEPTCTDPGQAKFIATAEYNGVWLEDIHTITLSALGHEWGEPEYVWTEDKSSVAAKRVCAHDASHIETETINTTNEVTTPATCTTDGVRTYTAIFTNELFETQTKTETIAKLGHTPGEPVEENRVEATCKEDGSYDEVVYCSVCHAEIGREEKTIPATGHEWGEPEYIWSEDKSSMTATAICAHDASHVETETVKTTNEVTTPATCTADGVRTYTAAFTNEIFNPQSKTETIAKLSHTPGEPVEENRVEATCTEDGSHDEVVYCSVCHAEISRVEKPIPATGHAWGEPTYKWTEDNSGATASAICTHNGAHTMTEVVQTTNEITTPATCTADGVRTYTAKFTNGLFVTQTKTETIAKLSHTPGDPVEENRVEATCTEDGNYDEVVYCSVCKAEISRVKKTIPATGHAYGEPEWKWSEDFRTATATFTCKHDELHTYEVKAEIGGDTNTIKPGKRVEAQRHVDGSQDYTAKITGPDGTEYKDETTQILPATHKVHKDKKSKDGKSMAIDVETDTLKAVVTGGVSATAPALVASYDENGRFLGLEVVTKTAEVVEPAENAESIKILWIDSNGYKPQSEAETIERQ